MTRWRAFQDELERRQASGRPAELWWRDDDAAAVTPALKSLLALSKGRGIPLALAVIPEAAHGELFKLLHPNVSVLQHGTDHRNRAAPGEKKTEYPASEPIESALARVADGLGRLRVFAGAKLVPALAPPWNRVRPDLLKKLPAIGIRGISTYGPRESAEPRPSLRQVNTHVDIVDWRHGRRFIGEARALELAMKGLASGEPVGFLTHHAVHDAAAWTFLERLFNIPGARWLSAAQAFSYTAPANG